MFCTPAPKTLPGVAAEYGEWQREMFGEPDLVRSWLKVVEETYEVVTARCREEHVDAHGDLAIAAHGLGMALGAPVTGHETPADIGGLGTGMLGLARAVYRGDRDAAREAFLLFYPALLGAILETLRMDPAEVVCPVWAEVRARSRERVREGL